MPLWGSSDLFEAWFAVGSHPRRVWRSVAGLVCSFHHYQSAHQDLLRKCMIHWSCSRRPWMEVTHRSFLNGAPSVHISSNVIQTLHELGQRPPPYQILQTSLTAFLSNIGMSSLGKKYLWNNLVSNSPLVISNAIIHQLFRRIRALNILHIGKEWEISQF